MTDNAPWPARAGAAVVVKNGYIYLLGGERGFTCGGAPGCNAERHLYFNDVWRSKDGGDWELVTSAAGWSARPGHQCVLLSNRIACFGGYGEPHNPDDIWVSGDGKEWEELGAPASPPWNAATPDDVKYDFDALVVRGCRSGLAPSIAAKIPESGLILKEKCAEKDFVVVDPLQTLKEPPAASPYFFPEPDIDTVCRIGALCGADIAIVGKPEIERSRGTDAASFSAFQCNLKANAISVKDRKVIVSAAAYGLGVNADEFIAYRSAVDKAGRQLLNQIADKFMLLPH